MFGNCEQTNWVAANPVSLPVSLLVPTASYCARPNLTAVLTEGKSRIRPNCSANRGEG